MEMLDIVDTHGEPTGQTVERSIAHAQGILHRTAHVWLLRKKDKKAQVLLQKRSADKDSFPGCYDISSAGHIPAGAGFVESALRELSEELGVSASPEQLLFCGDRMAAQDRVFRGQPFHDREYSRVFCLWHDSENFALQKEEVESVLWMEYEKCLANVRENSIKHCIFSEELEMLRHVIY